jgi:glycosyltransferase involved in cell wall biosynthesis
MAWNLIACLSRHCTLTVLTSAQNRPAIERALEEQPLEKVTFCYVDLPVRWRALQRYQGGIQLFAYLWQWKAYFVARRLHKKAAFHLFHHMTYENDWMASITGALLPVAYVRGPGGGAHRIPRAFLRAFPLRGRLAERLRVWGQWVFRHDPFFVAGQRRAVKLLVGNKEAYDAVPRGWREKTRILPLNGVSARDLAIAATGTTSQGRKFRALCAGRLARIKAFDLAINAFKTFCDRCERTNLRGEPQLVIVGQGPELANLQKLVSQLGLQDRTEFRPWVPRDVLLKQMAECDVFLFPSVRDGGGLVVVEAMAAGKPVLCLDMGGPGLHVNDECGIKVKPTSPEEAVSGLAAGLERLYRDPQLCEQMGRAARSRAEGVYRWDRLADEILQVYRQALGEEAAVQEAPTCCP